MKTCTKCGNKYPSTLRYFSAKKAGKNGLASWCKTCYKEYGQLWRVGNRTRLNESARKRRAANPERYREADLRWKAANQERRRESDRDRKRRERIHNPEKLHEYDRQWRSRPRNRLSKAISCGVRHSLKNGKGGHRWEHLIGYTVDDLIAHLESQFIKGMTWDNYGDWEIDHIRPVADFNFDFPNDPEFLECWSLWNLQPLWALDNKSKGPRCETPPLPLLHGETA